MEVHHSSHSSRPSASKWKTYVWEFFMLFCAVTLGFFAENKREEFSEHKQEKKYMQMLADDLQADIREIQRNEIARLQREQRLETLIGLLTSGKPILAEPVYRLTLQTDGYESFLRNDRTIQELKSSGGMRTIRNKTVSAAMMGYENFITAEVDWNNKTEASRIDYYKQLRFQLLHAGTLNSLVNSTKINQYKLMPVQPAVINQVAGALFQVKRISETCRESGKIAIAKAQKLMALIKTEYYIK